MKCSIFKEDKVEFDVSNERYQILFGFENVYGIFRSFDSKTADTSEEYNLIFFQSHNSLVPDDVLKDLIYLTRSGEVNIAVNDIVSIKINGSFASYRFSGMKNHDPEQSGKNFVEISGFLNKEKSQYIDRIHEDNAVLSVLDGKIHSIKSIDLNSQVFYCIDNEVFGQASRAASIMSDYSLYALNNLAIKVINPYTRPFVSIQHALYYYSKYQKKNASSVLLLNRKELEMVKDYHQLKQMAI